MPPQQRYVSRELTHFVGRSLPDDDARYDLLVKVLKSRWLTHPPHVPAPSDGGKLTVEETAFSSNEMYSSQVVCFCDIPVADLAIHMLKYGSFGLAFHKSFLVAHGAAPVFYIPRASAVNSAIMRCVAPELFPKDSESNATSRAKYFNEALRTIVALSLKFNVLIPYAPSAQPTPGMAADPQEIGLRWAVLQEMLHWHVFSFIKFFDHDRDDTHDENFYMEREWRMLGNLNFALANVRRVILPEQYAKRFCQDVPEYCGQLTFAD
ncbi:abortive infection system antitoxin AbiGi family protein [Planctomycetota bacterium]